MRWEIDATLKKKHGLIAARLPTATVSPDNKVMHAPINQAVPSRLRGLAPRVRGWLGHSKSTLRPLRCKYFSVTPSTTPMASASRG